mmetsp:Transcript_36837/g.113943  ORF Transcript_36837/g.113943 Transcript_36837/m.113943 type:complete len:157 (-) Transcript_36837:37-507(-)
MASKLSYANSFFKSLGSMSDSDEEKELPRDFLNGKIEKFSAKLEKAKSAGDADDIAKYEKKVAKFQSQLDDLGEEKEEPYELPHGTTDEDADAYVEHLSSRAVASDDKSLLDKLKTIATNKKAKRALMDIKKNGLAAVPKYAMDSEIQGLLMMLIK